MSEQAQVDEALRGLRDMLATDGYELRWSLSSPGTVLVQVVAGEGACADCLVPRPLMEGILSDALGPTPYALDRVVLPADGLYETVLSGAGFSGAGFSRASAPGACHRDRGSAQLGELAQGADDAEEVLAHHPFGIIGVA